MNRLSKYAFIFWYFLVFALSVFFGYLFFELVQKGFSTAIIITCVFYFLNVLFVFFIFVQKRHSFSKLSWIMLIALVPFVGYLIFVIFGQKYRGAVSIKNYHQRKAFTLEKEGVAKTLSILNKQRLFSKRGVHSANIELISSGNNSYKKMFEDMEGAKKLIFIQFYIIKPGEIYEHFKSILVKKARQGVKVKIIIDDFGRWALPWYEISLLRRENIEVAIFGKVHFPFIGSKNGYRMHRKMVLIDNQIVHTGGLNIAEEYASLNKKYGYWVDLQAKIKGPLVNSYFLLFAEDWKQITKKELLVDKPSLCSPNPEDNNLSQGILVEDSPEIKDSILEDSIISWIHNAKKEIKITTPYFIPTHGIFKALKTAAQTGVQVTVFIPGKPDKKSALIVSKFWANELLHYGVKFKVTQNILIHSKVGVFDNTYAYLGTANVDIRSLFAQFEFLNLVSGPVIKDIQKQFDMYDKMSKNLRPKRLAKNPLVRNVQKVASRFFAYFFSPIM